MPRVVNRLHATALKGLVAPGLHADGGGLYLQVTGGGGRSWIYRFWVSGRERQMGLGSLHTVSLAEARAAALEARRLRFRGIDPLEERRGSRGVSPPLKQASVRSADKAPIDRGSHVDAIRASGRSIHRRKSSGMA